jgi:hypothetical protein
MKLSRMSVGEDWETRTSLSSRYKLIVLGAQKGVAKKVFGIGQEPKSEYRPEEPIDCVVSMRSFDARMITAPLQYCLANKFIVELDRQVKDIMGIKQDYTVHHKDLEP